MPISRPGHAGTVPSELPPVAVAIGAAGAGTTAASIGGGTGASGERRDEHSGGSPPLLPGAAAGTGGRSSSSQQYHHHASSSSTALPPALSAAAHAAEVPKPRLTLPQMLGLFAVSFAYAFVFNTVNSVVVPKEVERLLTSRQSVWVGALMAAGAVCQCATPIVGAWSDRNGNNRTRYLIYGAGLTVFGVVLFLFSSSVYSIGMLVAAQTVTTIGLSIQYAMVTALLNDFVREEQAGLGSGAMAILAILGSGTGYGFFALGLPLHYSFIGYMVATIVCLLVTLLSVPTTGGGENFLSSANSSFGGGAGGGYNYGEADDEYQRASGKHHPHPSGGAPTRHVGGRTGGTQGTGTGTGGGGGRSQHHHHHTHASHSSGGGKQRGISPSSGGGSTGGRRHSSRTGPPSLLASWCCGRFWSVAAESLTMPSPSKYPDFFYACLGRACFNAGLGGQVYLIYYLRDVLDATDPVQVTSVIAVLALLGGVLGALPAGVLSDRVGKKPVIYWSIAVCVASLALFMVGGNVRFVEAVGFVYGMGNVGYLSVDYALGVHALPRRAVTIGGGGLSATVAVTTQAEVGTNSSAVAVPLPGGDELFPPTPVVTTGNASPTTLGVSSLAVAAAVGEGGPAGGGAVASLSSPATAAAAAVSGRPSQSHSQSQSVMVPIDAAKDLGIFAMSATVGQLLGQILYGTLLDYFVIAVTANNAATTPSAHHRHHATLAPGQGGSGSSGGGGALAGAAVEAAAAVVAAATTTVAALAPGSASGSSTTGTNSEVMLRYSATGFLVIYTISAAAFIGSGIATMCIRGVK